MKKKQSFFDRIVSKLVPKQEANERKRGGFYAKLTAVLIAFSAATTVIWQLFDIFMRVPWQYWWT